MAAFEWDPAKAAGNVRKHGVRFADAVSVLEDDRALAMPDDVRGEQRWVTVDLDSLGRILTVVYAWRGDSVRLISARQATPAERRHYLELK